jgi:hypothetical protein
VEALNWPGRRADHGHYGVGGRRSACVPESMVCAAKTRLADRALKRHEGSTKV